MLPSPLPLPVDTDDAALTQALERNTAELLLRMGDAGGGHRRSDAVSWTLGGSPLDYHNAVVAADLDAQSVEAAIRESLDTLRHARLPGSWHVGPSMRPTDVRKRLEHAGFAVDGDEPGMAARLHSVVPVTAPDLHVEVVRTASALEEWILALGSGFGEGPREAEWVGEMFRRIGLEHPDWRHLLARREGRVVGTATLLLAAGVGGLYFVMTAPDARRQGIGSQITRAAMRIAADAGMNHAILTSSVMASRCTRQSGSGRSAPSICTPGGRIDLARARSSRRPLVARNEKGLRSA
ncbi:GNAT family N-acetyltransferase [Microbacterium paludicola]|uniref:GNAT family N-acetyltransferase n=1 Tax=Microbacterium paludicola TaxID=300019 RepID=UPI001C92FE21|nr:GNAT family N-acetyltransferase [Microbacterium paludicola]